MIVLYGPRELPQVRKVATALALKQLDYELREPRAPADYRRFNPETGLLPVLAIGSERRSDPREIMAWLDERYPTPALFSKDPRVAALQRQLAEWVDETFLWYWERLQSVGAEGSRSGSPTSEDEAERTPPGDEPPRPAGVSLRDWLGRRLRPEGRVRRPEVDRLVYELDHRVADLARLLADRPYFHSDEPSLADVTVYANLRALERRLPAAAELVPRHANLARFVERIAREAEDGHF